ncbi:multiubiquitin domain-containing protein [Parabacteroides sp. FAFU027]|uniref:multiubiquitin domain-containing protein n=1 Tax=Parabacteroides sp. FAFU027 TaxID=2922715 RepID=UPI001FAED625|nr:multiubiquitin domain-containing protein [Parabacteroides sp. FAFU027]
MNDFLQKNEDKGNGKHVLRLVINQQNYEWHQQYITGAEVRTLGNIPENEELYLAIKNPWDDELIQIETNVDLARPGLERFYSKAKIYTIIVNGREKKWSEQTISYEQVAILAFENYAESESIVYTVNYTNGPSQNPESSMVKGDTVVVTNKMIFNVTATNRS